MDVVDADVSSDRGGRGARTDGNFSAVPPKDEVANHRRALRRLQRVEVASRQRDGRGLAHYIAG